MRYVLLTVALGPLLVPQGLWTRWRTPKLPEPPGERRGSAGQGAPLRLLIVGDSAAAGVGAASQSEALSGQLIARLTRSHAVSWRLEARTGATTATTLERLAALPAEPFDIAVQSLGVNDVTRGRSLDTWLAQQRQLWSMLRERFGVRHIVASGLPPVHGFPALPQPLRWFLGARATLFTEALERETLAHSDTHYLSLRFTEDLAMIASDGFHPGPGVYAEWGARCAGLIHDVTEATA